MGFPDRIERTVELAHPPDTVWAALTTADGLSAWFGNEAEIALHPGGAARMRWDDGSTAEMRVKRVEEPRVFAFTWQIYGLPGDDPRRTYASAPTVHSSGSPTRTASAGTPVWSQRAGPSSAPACAATAPAATSSLSQSKPCTPTRSPTGTR
jgi:uncharacterized protein YndB with AHSA1/START domain